MRTGPALNPQKGSSARLPPLSLGVQTVNQEQILYYQRLGNPLPGKNAPPRRKITRHEFSLVAFEHEGQVGRADNPGQLVWLLDRAKAALLC